MTKRKTTETFKEEVKNIVGDEYEVIGEYVNSKTNIGFIHKTCDTFYNATPDNFLRGRRCPVCSIKKVAAKRTLTREEVVEKIKLSSPFVELVGEYMGTKNSSQFKCLTCGNIWETKVGNILDGHGCPICGKRKSDDAKRLTEEEFKKKLSQVHGDKIECLEPYQGANNIKLKFKCAICNNIWEATPLNILAGRGCPECGKSRAGLQRRLTRDEVINKMQWVAPNTELVGDITTTKQKATFRCKRCGNEWNTDLGNVLAGKQCPKCAILDRKEKLAMTNDEFQKRLASKKENKITTTDTYDNARTRMEFHCEECGATWISTPDNILNGDRGCPECARHVSNKEKDLRAFVESLGVSPLYNVRDVIPPKELDIYIPEKNVAIEFNGNYWHGAEQKDKNYHYNKSKECEEKGIRLIHIFEYEWDNERQRPILENIIKHALGITEHELYARKCTIEERESASMREFFEKNNIQGFRGGQKAVCLVYQGEVIMSYIVGKCFFHKQPSYEIIRGATKLGYTVVGGASKLWRYIINKWNDLPILYYIDYNYFNGSSMGSLEGLRFVKVTPSFKNYWIKHWKTGEENVIKNREPMYHKEVMRAQAAGMGWPIYNAGTKTYIYEPSRTE